jgi:Rhodopirellula transposase DDE domain
VAALTKSHPDTVSRGARELEQGIEPGGRVRQAGAARPSATDLDPGLVDALRALVEPETRGDPMQPLVWTTKSTGNLAGELGKAGRPVSADTVGRLLKDRLGYSLQGNSKTIEGKQHPDRDAWSWPPRAPFHDSRSVKWDGPLAGFGKAGPGPAARIGVDGPGIGDLRPCRWQRGCPTIATGVVSVLTGRKRGGGHGGQACAGDRG